MGDEIFLGRQPIYDRDMQVVGYELLYRNGDVDHADLSDPEAASGRVLVDAVMGLGLDRLVGPHPAFVNVTADLLSTDRPLALPPERVVLELVEDTPFDDGLAASMAALRARGFRFALDGFTFRDGWERVLPHAEVVKLDVLNADPDPIARDVARLREHPVTRVAGKVETGELFTRCLGLGFDQFQGHFLCRPQVVRGRRPAANKLSLLTLLAELSDPAADAKRIEALVERDLGLSYRMLKYINAPYFGLARRVDSMRQAVVLLGLDAVRRWATLISVMEMSDKPAGLVATALVRGRMCEALARATGEAQPDVFFTVGLLSVLDALMDQPLTEVVASLPLADAVVTALLDREGAPGRALAVTVAYEQGQWDRVGASGLPNATLRDAYLDAITWADATGAVLGTAP